MSSGENGGTEQPVTLVPVKDAGAFPTKRHLKGVVGCLATLLVISLALFGWALARTSSPAASEVSVDDSSAQSQSGTDATGSANGAGTGTGANGTGTGTGTGTYVRPPLYGNPTEAPPHKCGAVAAELCRDLSKGGHKFASVDDPAALDYKSLLQMVDDAVPLICDNSSSHFIAMADNFMATCKSLNVITWNDVLNLTYATILKSDKLGLDAMTPEMETAHLCVDILQEKMAKGDEEVETFSYDAVPMTAEYVYPNNGVLDRDRDRKKAFQERAIGQQWIKMGTDVPPNGVLNLSDPLVKNSRWLKAWPSDSSLNPNSSSWYQYQCNPGELLDSLFFTQSCCSSACGATEACYTQSCCDSVKTTEGAIMDVSINSLTYYMGSCFVGCDKSEDDYGLSATDYMFKDGVYWQPWVPPSPPSAPSKYPRHGPDAKWFRNLLQPGFCNPEQLAAIRKHPSLFRTYLPTIGTLYRTCKVFAKEVGCD